MIKALIVDNEKLVRKGIISIFPWEQFQIEIVGEANHGRAALEFLQAHTVHLIFIDLTMPEMSGLELMKRVKQLYPSIWMVVLTCHPDFEYIQEALRLGALDYIIKTQLDKEKIDDILNRIMSRIQIEEKKFFDSKRERQ